MVILVILALAIVTGNLRIPGLNPGDSPSTGGSNNTVTVDTAAIEAAKASLASVASVVPDSTTQSGYNRTASFGTAWKDVDRNGCDTRNDMLKRDLKNTVFKQGSNCVVNSGVLDPDPYTGKKIVWQKGDNPGIDIDHMVPLKRAWSMGANKWTQAQREAYANDPFILVTVDASANRSKSDQGPGTWMPTVNKCDYAVRYISATTKYKLSLTTSDVSALKSALKGCVVK